MKLGNRVFVCLRNEQLPPKLRKHVRPYIVGPLACWFDRTEPHQKTA